jgi:glucokinase
MKAIVPVLEIGGTHVSAALVDTSLWALVPGSSRREPLDSDGTKAEILGRIARCASDLGAERDATWGVAIPGPFDYANGVGAFDGVRKFDALRGTNVRQSLLDSIQPKPKYLVFVNDAQAFALGEWQAGAAAGHSRAVAITLGTGVGSGFVADGSVVDHGPEVPPEGRVDLLTVNAGPLEDSASRHAILAAYSRLRREPNDPDLDVRDLAQLARDGDIAASEAITTAVATLGRVLAPWLELFCASVLVVGGSISGSWDLILEPLRSGINSVRPDVLTRMTVTRARHPETSGQIGAAVSCIKAITR